MSVPLDQFVRPQTNSTTATPTYAQTGSQIVQSNLEALLNPNSQYIQNARRQGANVAAQRGGINASIAAGAAERAATEAALPLAQQAINIEQSRENVAQQDWISNQNFNRALRGQVFSNSLGMLNSIQEYALNDPELYTPEVTSGYSNFFQRNLRDILSTYFKDFNLG